MRIKRVTIYESLKGNTARRMILNVVQVGQAKQTVKENIWVNIGQNKKCSLIFFYVLQMIKYITFIHSI